jgi:hypothetical protein
LFAAVLGVLVVTRRKGRKEMAHGGEEKDE